MTESMQSQAVTLPSSTLKSIASQLVGVWRLVSYAEEQNGREDSFPFGLNQRASSFIRRTGLYRHS